ncbi:hypothetical protein Dip510_000498 [Elusimicrobium posterum]|uniref:DciA family protein n=1 Tax=Elusimicrobium posterum TaxID=3116653 RepID=UPI003C77166E
MYTILCFIGHNKMKFGAKPREIWKKASDLQKPFNPLTKKLNRLMILANIWDRLVGKKAKFWVLDSADKDTIYVKVKVAAAKHDLAANSSNLVRELNKHFDKPWIKEIKLI